VRGGNSFGVWLWWLGFFALVAVRWLLLCGLVMSGRMEALGLAALECVALVLGVVNAVVSEDKDYRPRGFVVPICYALGVWLMPGGGESFLLARWVLFLIALWLSTWGLVCLGQRFSIGSSAWVSLCDWGPYGVIRHPQLFARLLILVSVAVSGVDWQGVALLTACACLTFIVIDLEESLLTQFEAWRNYRDRVCWRLLPGLY
jgi:protein-S-isoprenylcysteine O-methyltransferase Ste14